METLSKADSDLFYKLWRPLLQHINMKQKIFPKVDFEHDEKVDVDKCNTAAGWLWEHKDVLDEFLAEHPEFSERESAIVRSWKQAIRDNWFIERHLKTGSIFIGNHDKVFLVQGIISSYKEMFWAFPTPVYVTATLLPFEDHIITDGLISVMSLISGPGIKRMLREEYTDAKKAGEVISTWPSEI